MHHLPASTTVMRLRILLFEIRLFPATARNEHKISPPPFLDICAQASGLLFRTQYLTSLLVDKLFKQPRATDEIAKKGEKINKPVSLKTT
jgi:hypothetical protein